MQQRCGFAKAKGKEPEGKKLQAKKFSGGKKGDSSAVTKKGKPEGADDGNPRLQQIVSMLTAPPPSSLSESEEEQQASALRIRAYNERKVKGYSATLHDLHVKYHLQHAALHALPPALRKMAELPDFSPFPMNRKFLFDTPPASYKD